VRRRFLLRLPADYDPTSRHPIVLDLHGYGSTAAIQHAYSGFSQIADEHSFIGVWPDGSGDCLGETPGCEHSWEDCSSCLQGWNCLGTSVGQSADGMQTCNPDRKAWGHYECYASCGTSCEPREDNTTDTCVSSSCWDDIGFIDAVLDWLLANLCVNEERIHLSGLSNGAMMNYQLASSHVGHRIASMVPVAGLPLLGFLDAGPWSAVPVRPIALMDVHGMLDHVGAETYPYDPAIIFLRRLAVLFVMRKHGIILTSRTDYHCIILIEQSQRIFPTDFLDNRGQLVPRGRRMGFITPH
jgi:hypothetical protein